MNLDSIFGVHAQAALLRSYRTEVLANNIANAETPGFKARDLDFKALLNSMEAVSSGNNSKPISSSRIENALLYRIPTQASLDGNTVDMDVEKAAFAKNAIDYEISMSFLGGKIRGILTAIRGE